MTDLIQWKPNGFEGLGGYVPGASTPFFAIVDRDGDGPLVLLSSLPGQREHRGDAGRDPEPLKAQAERLLREFAVSVVADPDHHVYLSTYCLHGNCGPCSSPQGVSALGETWTRTPGSCKECGSPCIHPCHAADATGGDR
jgi:hypothetical protein